jgi:Putative lumazine-binding
MNKSLVLCAMLLSGSLVSQAQQAADLAKIEAVVREFSAAGDQQDAARLEKILHPQYRAVVNRLFGSPDLSLMDRALYLQLISDKKIGGDTREVFLLQIDLLGNTASVKSIFRGKVLNFTTFVSLVKLPDGTWQIISDMPEIEKV